MSQGFGREVPAPHIQTAHREATKYLVVIPAAEGPIAKLLLANREQAAELDANTEEATSMTRGLTAFVGATGPEWDKALSGHSAAERAAAKVYTFTT
jgi:hypothetical protein